MKAKIFLLISTLLIAVGLATIVFFNVDPRSSSVFVKTIFFVSIWYVIFSTYIIATLRSRAHAHSLRRAVILSCLVVGLLTLSSLGILNYLSALTYFVALALIEIFFLTKQKA